MAQLPAVCSAIATQVRTVVPTAYPGPSAINATPLVVLYGNLGGVVYRGGSEQEWLENITGLLYMAPVKETRASLAKIDALIDPIADLFTADDQAKHTLNGLVDFCKLGSYETGQILEYAAQNFWGATLVFSVKRRRFAGDS